MDGNLGHGVYEYSEIMQWAWTEAGIVRKACRFIAKHQANDLLRQVRLAANVEVRWPAPTVGNVDAE